MPSEPGRGLDRGAQALIRPAMAASTQVLRAALLGLCVFIMGQSRCQRVTATLPTHSHPEPVSKHVSDQTLIDHWADLNVSVPKGLIERFDASIGATTVLSPLAGALRIAAHCPNALTRCPDVLFNPQDAPRCTCHPEPA